MPVRQLSEDEITALRAMLDSWEKSRWLGRLVWKIGITIGAVAAGVATFKENIIAIFHR